MGFKRIGIPYTRAERYAGATNNSFWWNIVYAKRLILSFSYKPLEWISFLAFVVVILTGMAMIAYLTLYFILPHGPRGIPTLILLILFLGAIQLFALAVIGEYLGKIFEEVKGRPKSLVQEAINYRGQKILNKND